MNKRKKQYISLAVVFAINIFIISFVQYARAATYQRGSYGSTVKQIQTTLSNWGYYNGSIDGIYGSATEKAVKWFQSKNGLTSDGRAGPKTLQALGIQTQSATSSSNADVDLLARTISAEARGEPYSGQVAVGAVILNRIKHPSFPNTLSGVVYQSGAFSCIYDGQFYEKVSDSAYKAAREAMNGSDPSGGAIYYYNPRKATNTWIRSRPIITVIGGHYFCS